MEETALLTKPPKMYFSANPKRSSENRNGGRSRKSSTTTSSLARTSNRPSDRRRPNRPRSKWRSDWPFRETTTSERPERLEKVTEFYLPFIHVVKVIGLPQLLSNLWFVLQSFNAPKVVVFYGLGLGSSQWGTVSWLVLGALTKWVTWLTIIIL